MHSVEPVEDDRPYFYLVDRVTGIKSAFIAKAVFDMFIVAVLGALILITLPVLRVARGEVTRLTIGYAGFFALTGFSFLLFQASIIQMFAVFAGGPIYSLAVVLVAVLAGYSVGSLLADYLKPHRATFIAIGFAIAMVMLGLYAWLPDLLAFGISWALPGRLFVCGAITFCVSVLIGIPVPLAMTVVRAQHGSVVGWMWGVSSAFNVLGAMSFVPLTQVAGISFALLLVGLLYLIAGVSTSVTHLTLNGSGR